MKQILRHLMVTAALTLAAASLAAAEPVTLVFDRGHSEVGFNIRHFFNKVHGRFKDFSGTVLFDGGNLAASSVEVSIVDSTIDTANERRDAHLRTADFFDAAKTPLITFKSTKVVPGKDATHFQVVGDFTMRGVTKPVTLEAEMLGMGPIAIGGNSLGTQGGFIATTTINRQNWGIIWNKTLDQGGMMLGDDVDIVLNIAVKTPEAPKPAPAPAATTDKK